MRGVMLNCCALSTSAPLESLWAHFGTKISLNHLVNTMAKYQEAGRSKSGGSSYGSDPLVRYDPHAIAESVWTTGLTPVELAAKSNGQFSFQWLYSVLEGYYPRCRHSKLLALSRVTGLPIQHFTHR